MTNGEVARIEIKGIPLAREAKAKCAMCGTSLNCGRVKSPGFNYGVVLCPTHVVTWMDVLISSLTDFPVNVGDVLRDLGLL